MENQENVKAKKRSLNDEFFGFRGSENYYKYSPLFSGFFITDGVNHIVKKLGLYWFLDVVLSYQTKASVKALTFQVWKLERITEGRNAGKWEVSLYDDSTPVLKQIFRTIILEDGYEEKFDVFKIYLLDGILLLPSEY